MTETPASPSGAEFFRTQAIYDIGKFKDFMAHARRLKTKVMAGIVLLVSAGMAKYMNANPIPSPSFLSFIFAPPDGLARLLGGGIYSTNLSLPLVKYYGEEDR